MTDKTFPEAALLRLQELANLNPGWLDGEGEVIQTKALQDAYTFIADLVELNAPLPRIYPTAQGGIQLEWHRPGLSIEVQISGGVGYEIFSYSENALNSAQAISRLLQEENNG